MVGSEPSITPFSGKLFRERAKSNIHLYFFKKMSSKFWKQADVGLIGDKEMLSFLIENKDGLRTGGISKRVAKGESVLENSRKN